jgi:acetoin utilization protein AcuB
MKLTVERWMKAPVHTVKPRDSVAHARAILEQHRINQLPVVQAGKLVGIVTDRDLRDAPRAVEIAASAASGHSGKADAEKIAVEAVMSSNVKTLKPTDTIEEAARVMRRERYGALPVVDKGVLSGILTRSDLLDVLLEIGRRLQEKGIEL